ncbi:MAG TPA: DnaJ domain-containing protein [Acidimicrobiia bacterium]
MSQNFYEVLDVPATASQGEILDAFLAGMGEAHPDVVVSSDHHKARDRYVAFTVLSNSADREKYDLALAGADHCPWCGNLLAAYGLEHHVAEHVVKHADDGCIVCGRLPAQRFDFRANSGRVLWHKVDRVAGNLCKTCATGEYRAMQARNLARGPWSIVSFFTTPYVFVRNWLVHRKTSSLPGPRPHDPGYDRDTGLGRPVVKSPSVWASVLGVTALVVVVTSAILANDGSSSGAPDAEVEQTTSTTVDPNDGWVVGGCARADVAGRVFPAECGDHIATVVALVPAVSDCPESFDFSVTVTEGVACFEEES